MNNDFQLAIGKGCLAGLALAAAFFVVGGLLFLAARLIGFDQGVSLVVGLAGGPMLVSAVVLGVALRRAQNRSQVTVSNADHATIARDDA